MKKKEANRDANDRRGTLSGRAERFLTTVKPVRMPSVERSKRRTDEEQGQGDNGPKHGVRILAISHDVGA